MTIPRDLRIKHVGNDILVASEPVKELKAIELKSTTIDNINAGNGFDLASKTGPVKLPCRIDLDLDKSTEFSLTLSNSAGEKLIIGYDKSNNQYFIDRTNSGKKDFQKDFGGKHTAPRFVTADKMDVTLIIDESSVELFADEGLSVMTEIFFPSTPYDKVNIQAGNSIKKIQYTPYKSIWP